MAPESDCAAACSGDPIHLCGGSERLSLYFWSQEDPLYVWHTPEVTGFYEYFMSGLIPPVIATLGINNKVSFLEKQGTARSKS